MTKKQLKRINKQVFWLKHKLRYAKTEIQKDRFTRIITNILTKQAFEL